MDGGDEWSVWRKEEKGERRWGDQNASNINVEWNKEEQGEEQQEEQTEDLGN